MNYNWAILLILQLSVFFMHLWEAEGGHIRSGCKKHKHRHSRKYSNARSATSFPMQDENYKDRHLRKLPRLSSRFLPQIVKKIIKNFTKKPATRPVIKPAIGRPYRRPYRRPYIRPIIKPAVNTIKNIPRVVQNIVQKAPPIIKDAAINVADELLNMAVAGATGAISDAVAGPVPAETPNFPNGTEAIETTKAPAGDEFSEAKKPVEYDESVAKNNAKHIKIVIVN
ncbi:uncharacterized protein LOC117780035 isoform X2 [Drosophila innubila]|uniref:uncharacterized protein LOC117780035 isoform X2 n=1 Tax=Drosophila innubila TaxID=198719 RepID=UPI00148C894E|nr:uncharacterized protein LOC117780035 isoform X2 [Drosophila innubila]